MSDQRGKADDLEQRYVGGETETEELVEGLDPADTDREATEQVEAVADGEGAADDVEKMTRDDP